MASVLSARRTPRSWPSFSTSLPPCLSNRHSLRALPPYCAGLTAWRGCDREDTMTFWEFLGAAVSSAGLFASILGAFLPFLSLAFPCGEGINKGGDEQRRDLHGDD